MAISNRTIARPPAPFPLSRRVALVVVTLLSSWSGRADEGEPVGDPPPPPDALVEEPPPEREPVVEQPPLPAPVVEERARSGSAPARVRVSKRRAGPSAVEVVGLGLGGGVVAGLVGAAAAGAGGGATLASLILLETALPEPERGGVAFLTLVAGVVLTPFAAGLTAAVAFLFVTRPTASPEEYAEIAQACASCAASVACLGLCLTGAFIGGPSIIFSPACGFPFRPGPGLSGPENIPALAAGAGAGAGVVVGGLASFVAVRPVIVDPLLAASFVVAGAAAGALVGGFLVGSGAYVIEQWRFIDWE